jgi:hypothetical protein
MGLKGHTVAIQLSDSMLCYCGSCYFPSTKKWVSRRHRGQEQLHPKGMSTTSCKALDYRFMRCIQMKVKNREHVFSLDSRISSQGKLPQSQYYQINFSAN